METKPPLSPATDEKAKSDKDKKSTKYDSGLRLPLSVASEPKTEKSKPILNVEDWKPKENKTEHRDETSQAKLPAETEKATAAEVTESTQRQRAASEDLTPNVEALPSAEEVLAKINQRQEAQEQSATPESSVGQQEAKIPESSSQHEPTGPATELPMERGEVELPLDESVDADELNRRLQAGQPEQEPELAAPASSESSEPQRSDPEVHQQTSPQASTESLPPPLAMAAAGEGGGNYEPPRPPGEGQASPQPEQPDRPNGPESSPGDTRNTPDSISRQFGNEVWPSAPLPIDRLSNRETSPQTIVQRPEHTGLLAALAVGAIDWYGRHKVRRELRRGQAKQDKRLRETQRALENIQTEQLQQPVRQRSIVERLQTTVDDLTARLRRPEAKPSTSTHPNHPVKAASPERQDTLPIAAMAAASAERHTQSLQRQHEIKSSAWHSYEVDRKTGRLVEHPSFVYGREFRRERGHELHRSATPAGVAGTLAVLSSGVVPAPGTTPSDNGRSTPLQPYETTIRETPQINLPIVGQVQKSWLWAGLVVMVFIIISALILS